ncbi:hypothetical protein N7490_011337 [Penicillium lividum]|nr:hypothetical protein N7490_011337 [Penicillium lividum]
MSGIPSFTSLPLRIDGPPGNAWGLFGANDECGMLNRLTPDVVKSASQETDTGIRIPTDLPLDSLSKKPCFGRPVFQHTIKNKAPRAVNDDMLQFNTQISSQWNGFRHYGYQESKDYFNGYKLEDLLNTHVNGINYKLTISSTYLAWLTA